MRPRAPAVHRELASWAREIIEFARARHTSSMSGNRAAADRLGEGLHRCTNSEYSISLSGAGPAGELHAGLELAVALARGNRPPTAALDLEPFDEHQLAADVTLRRQMGDGRIAPRPAHRARSARRRRSARRAAAAAASRAAARAASCRPVAGAVEQRHRRRSPRAFGPTSAHPRSAPRARSAWRASVRRGAPATRRGR